MYHVYILFQTKQISDRDGKCLPLNPRDKQAFLVLRARWEFHWLLWTIDEYRAVTHHGVSTGGDFQDEGMWHFLFLVIRVIWQEKKLQLYLPYYNSRKRNIIFLFVSMQKITVYTNSNWLFIFRKPFRREQSTSWPAT